LVIEAEGIPVTVHRRAPGSIDGGVAGPGWGWCSDWA
jgi:hypothetical protein